MLYTQSGWLVSYNTDTLVYIIIQSILWFLKSWTEAKQNNIKNKTLAYINRNIFLCAFFVAFIAVFFRFLIFVFLQFIVARTTKLYVIYLFFLLLRMHWKMASSLSFAKRKWLLFFWMCHLLTTQWHFFSFSKYINIAKILFDTTHMHAVVYVLFSNFFDWKMYFSSLV